jgi:hypothetical protein
MKIHPQTEVAVTGGELSVTNGVIGIGNDGTITSGSGVGSMAVSNGTVTASAILLGSTVGGQGHLILGDGGLISGIGTNVTLTIDNSVTVQALQCSASLNVAGGNLSLTKGNSQVAGSFTVASSRSLSESRPWAFLLGLPLIASPAAGAEKVTLKLNWVPAGITAFTLRPWKRDSTRKKGWR